MSSEEHTGKVAATVIPRTREGQEYLVTWRVDHGMWEFPGGKQKEDESLLQTAEREIEEELGLEIEAVETAERSWEAGGYEIVPVLASHSYKDIEQQLELREDKHGKYRYIEPGNYSIELGNEENCLEAFDLR